VADVAPPHGDRHSWLEHPAIAARYRQRGLIDGLPWDEWAATQWGEPARKSLQLSCGGGDRSFYLFERGLSRWVDGVDASEEQIAAAERRRSAYKAPGFCRVLDANAQTLRRGVYDLVFASHNFHQFVALEHVLEQARAALTPRGLFVIEGYTGPSRFQWTDLQMDLVRALLSAMPDRLRLLPWGDVKTAEGRPDRGSVAAVAPLESIRSAEIAPLFERYFEPIAVRRLGGTIQNLLFNGIMRHFGDADPDANRHVEAVGSLESLLIDRGLLPSDFQIMIGRPR